MCHSQRFHNRVRPLGRTVLIGSVAIVLGACSSMPWSRDDSPRQQPAAQNQTPLTTPRRPVSEAPTRIAEPTQPAAPTQTTTMGSAPASPVRLNPNAPDQYVVQRGDTLWDISGVFLQDPWYWPEIWQINPQVENPHLIYPGDRLTLV